MYSGLLIILLPLILGWLLPLRQPSVLRFVNRLLGWMVYIILFFMGIILAFLDNLSSNLLSVFHIALISALAILLCNLLALRLLEKRLPWQHKHKQEALPSRLRMAFDSLTLCGVVVLGFLEGLTQLAFLRHASTASEYALIFLLFLVSVQLRGSGMTLRQILLNRRGMMVLVVVVLMAAMRSFRRLSCTDLS